VYTLIYAAGTNSVTYVIPVDNTYKIRVANLGIIDVAGKTYIQMKTQVESIVSNNYPLSGVQMVLTRPAVFKVYINGEVNNAAEMNVWGLSRLSSVLSGNLTNFSSYREVSIRSVNGQTGVFDIYEASRRGDLSQDPYLRPGDVVTISRANRSVTINGAVERPGAYQLLEGENLKELIEKYGSGFTVRADKSRIEMIRITESVSLSGDKIFLAEADVEGNYVLRNNDVITVPERTSLQPVIFVEGAVNAINSSASPSSPVSASPTVSTRLVVPFNKGENYASLIRRNQSWFSAVSDTRNAYIIRGAEHMSINLNPMLYDSSYRSEITIEENDTLIIPFRQYFVTVAGAVMVPGRYPYIPDREWDYYIALAGGFRPGQNAFESISITDITGKKMKKSDVIVPETIITARTNDFLYYFNQYSPVVITTLSIITTYLALRPTLNLP
jgi:protein involved in polysaccharide export with SLBB domain